MAERAAATEKPPMYDRPPVIEAVCEFRFIPSADWDWTIPGLLYDKVQADFPKKRTQNIVDVEMQVQAGQQGVTQKVGARMQFLNEEETMLVQVGPDLLAVNSTAYPSWGRFKPVVLRQLAAYQEVAKPKAFQRIGLRFINRIDVPMQPAQNLDLGGYFKVCPQVPEVDGVEPVFQRFVQQVEMPFGGDGFMRLIFATVEPHPEDRSSFILDLDFFSMNEMSLEVADDWIEQAHGRVEEMFLASFTPDAHRELFGRIEQ